LKPALILHGDAWEIEEESSAERIAGVRAAAEAGWAILSGGGSALDAVERAVALMEDNPVLNAGVGSALNRDGEIELDAIIMDGRTLALGSVAAVRGITNPVKLARLVMEDTVHSMLVGEGARRFAELKGMRLAAQAELTVPREVERFRRLQQQARYEPTGRLSPNPMDTVGAVALDSQGNVAAATSTGGVHFKMPGRVGDSPLVGCGAYADNRAGAAATTGHGESIMRVVLAKTATDACERGMSAQEAAEYAIRVLHERTGGYAGIVVVDRHGGIGYAYNTPQMAVAWVDENGTIRARLAQQGDDEGA
jgi:beta-aspartyl-peptidase (threonine type)